MLEKPLWLLSPAFLSSCHSRKVFQSAERFLPGVSWVRRRHLLLANTSETPNLGSTLEASEHNSAPQLAGFRVETRQSLTLMPTHMNKIF